MSERWKCQVCGGVNPGGNSVCAGCHTPRGQAVQTEKSLTDRKQWWAEVREKAGERPRWEYLVAIFQIERGGILGTSFKGKWVHEVINETGSTELMDEMDAFGELGWELISVMPNSNPVMIQAAGDTTEWVLFFRRQKRKQEAHPASESPQ